LHQQTVVFLTFWQESGLALLETAGVITDREYFSSASIVVGLAALLSCFEMMLFGKAEPKIGEQTLTLTS